MKLKGSFEIKLLSVTAKVNIVENIIVSEKGEIFDDIYTGYILYPRLIYVGTKTRNSENFSLEYIVKSLCHELAHCILTNMQFLSASSNEPLVENLGQNIAILLNPAIKKQVEECYKNEEMVEIPNIVI